MNSTRRSLSRLAGNVWLISSYDPGKSNDESAKGGEYGVGTRSVRSGSSK